MTFLKSIAATLVVCALLAGPAFANDSSAAITLGGLELTQNDDISMDSEELFLSADEVRVTYTYTNHADHDIDLLIAFPLPTLPLEGIEEMGDISNPEWDTLAFETKVNGQPADLTFVDIAAVGDRDVTAEITARGWLVRHWEDDAWTDKMQTLAFEDREALEASGILRRETDDTYLQPGWKAAPNVTRTQTFPAGETVTVEHRYTPLIGGSIGGNFSDMGDDADLIAWQDEFYAKYCVDESFKRGFKAAQARRGERGGMYIETYVDYRLAPGANWKGPIGKFRLVVDKGAPGNLVSLCMDGGTKISPTQFEFVKTDFEPDRDISLVIVNWPEP